MIEIKNISLAYGARKIFDGASAAINKGDRIGLVGANGAGKTTLLKILCGAESPDSGEIAKPKYAGVGYLPQDGIVAGSRPLYEEAESAFENVISLREKMAQADAVIAAADPSSREYAEAVAETGELSHRLEDAEESKVRPRVESVLLGLGFSMSDMNRPCSEFSGGWQMRVALAKLLLKEPSLLMLDEPTNHLDIESVAWLEDYLGGYSGAVIIVSHDRAFLDAVCNRTFHVVKGRLDVYAGDYEFFLKESAARKLHIERAAENQRREIEKTERFIERFRYKNTKAAQVQSRIKALEKIERIEAPEEDVSKISFRFPEPKRCGQVVLDVRGVRKSFGDHTVLGGVSFKIERGERVALVGVNGAGKTTLVKIIAGALGADAGEVHLGLNVQMSYFAQHQTEELNPANDVLSEALEVAPMERKGLVRNLLGSFLFSGNDVLKGVGTLSGGEKNRLALVKMLLKDFNFLVLDEPTNHLDMNSKEVLQKALASYGGTYLVVSHDRAFLDPIVEKVIELSPRGLREFPGNLSDYVERIRGEGKIASRPAARKSGASGAKERRIEAARLRENAASLRRGAEKIERAIAEAEEDLAKVEAEMSSPEFFKKGAQCASITENYNALKARIESLYAEWEAASARVTEAEAAVKAFAESRGR
ncbi:MAG: ABC-F family ATP-binding cassette domain-containing protein [Opitutales bacterium]|nr:ABC-F family ATP-binding cassette domain-containing protein [Opitutales bacterium]